MKSIKQITILLALLLVGITTTKAQEFSETLTDTQQFPTNGNNNLLVVKNIEGSITVEGYNGSTVQISAEKYVKGRNSRTLEQGKKEVSMKVEKKDEILYVYLDTPYSEFDLETGRFNHRGPWDGIPYEYRLDIKIKVPKNTSVELSAINKGEILVRDIDASEIAANNINGPIRLENIAGQTFVNALNKDINITYAKNPTADSVYKSLNGDININVQSGLNADVSFKTLNGDIFTNLETTKTPPKMNVQKKSGKRGVKYKINSNTEFRIGNGGVAMAFDLLNGNVTIKG